MHKDLFIRSIEMVEFEGNVNLPSVIYYGGQKREIIGSKAIVESIQCGKSHLLTDDFKIGLGRVGAKSIDETKFLCADNKTRSSRNIVSDFVFRVLQEVHTWLTVRGYERCDSIVIAEPLSMHSELVDNDWLSNYRQNLTRLISGKGFNNIDYLPEPFAVFQYYRYGLKHPALSGAKKHTALVVDFGGGTFDVCIVQTNKEGDVSQAKRHSRPLAASSEAIGGFFINRLIAEYIYEKVLQKKQPKSKIRQGFEHYRKWKKGEVELDSLNPSLAAFVKNFNIAVHEAEKHKIFMSKHLTNWSLDVDNYTDAVPFSIPSDPFAEESERQDIKFTANDFKKIFLEEAWEKHLHPTIRRTLSRAKKELDGEPISVVLLSGGSANIGWLANLIVRDFFAELEFAEILKIDDFQEVVAKGLAIECVRRFYHFDGDFASTTYNTLCLSLNPDQHGIEVKNFKFLGDSAIMKTDTPGVLVPTASLLQTSIGKKMCWRVQLNYPPKRRLDYYFLRSSVDPDDLENLHNVEERTLHTPKNVSFDSKINLELTISEDGTARPRFIYKRGANESQSSFVDGKPFYIDMTYGKSASGATSYIGFDFGSSNSSVSYVDPRTVQAYNDRKKIRGWLELNELINSLPYPLSVPLAKYFSQNTEEQLKYAAIEFIESVLAIAAFTAYSEYSVALSGTRRQTKLFKSFTQRSSGPLLALLRESLIGIGDKAVFSKAYNELLGEYSEECGQAIEFINGVKHSKNYSSEIDVLRIVKIFANIAQKAFIGNHFCFFSNVQKKRASKYHHGKLRVANGTGPFTKTYNYVGLQSYSEADPFIINETKLVALNLFPFVFWSPCQNHPDEFCDHIFIYDKESKDGNGYEYKAIGTNCTFKITEDSEYSELYEIIRERKLVDLPIELDNVEGLDFNDE